MKLNKLFKIEHLAQEFNESPKISRNNKNIIFQFDYETLTGGYAWAGLTFKDTIAYKVTSECCASVFMLEAYNVVTEVNQSEWLKEVEKSYKIGVELGRGTFDYKHYLVYFDGFGCYEFISREVIKGID